MSEDLIFFRFPGVRVLSQSSADVLSLESLRQQCEVIAIDTDGNPDDTLLQALGRAAVASAEKFTGLCILPRTLELALDKFPTGDIELPRPPLISFTSLTYGGEGSDAIALTEGEDFTVDPFGDLVRLRPVLSWPSAATLNSGIRAIYEAGYSPETDPNSDMPPLPDDLRAALLLHAAHLFKNREATSEKAMSVLPLGVEHLLRPHRVLTGFA
jgi:uncharacterized phiE125 gp8 family phage protein